MGYERSWARLLAYLDDWATAREVVGGIEVTLAQTADGPRTVEIVMTPAQWDDHVTTMTGGTDPAATHLRLAIESMPADRHYLVHDDRYDWQPSSTKHLPPDPADDSEPGSAGEWVVLDENGNVVDRLRDHLDP